MPAIRVDPAELDQVAGEMKRAEVLLGALAPQIRQRAGALDWETGQKSDLDELISQAALQAGTLEEGAATLTRALLDHAEAYRQADEQGQSRIERPLQWMGSAASGLATAIWQGAPGGPSAAQAPTPEQLRFLQRTLSVQEEGFGPKTTAALERLHSEYGLTMPPKGQIDPQAWALVGHQVTRGTDGGAPGAPAIPLQPFVPYHNQTDPAYADLHFGQTDTYERSGCTLTAIAMLVDYHRDSFEATRESMGALAKETVNADGNVVWAQADGYLQKQWGLELVHQELPGGPEALGTAMTEAHQALTEGEPVVIGVKNGANQHWVVVRGFTGQGAPSDPAQFLIHDPANTTRKTLADLLNDQKYQGGQLQAIVHVQERS
ncbi:MAG TPA: C39 family peptidase [Symbiobacteriaceae bacterium]|nr:C39 family peptidase [Symbiobacteriaceae bacterium]